MIDVPPYPSIRYTSRGFEAFREREEEKSAWDYSINEDKAEDINAEAEAFIKSMHRYVTALIEGKEIIISNKGDCRAVLCRNGVAEALTRDHRAEREDERKRIEDKGGYVELHKGGWRVHGVLTVSRSIGDAHLKDWVPAEPDTKTLSLTPDMEYLVLASDGIWDQVR
ncbi:probable protein phosphatase 2C 14 [Solanum stenotomum]|uniref:probable protein phosphatase 2C 14 n=1 Tax=Solanum stenotomum TaxID=172797 RepID=UPI0020D15B64|nr:probable protein phosphatase 2C 14 [Solanum stenotomum]